MLSLKYNLFSFFFFIQNLLAGAIYNVWIGFPLCCLLTACGSTLCFLLSKYFGHYLLEYYFPEKLDYFQKKFIEKQQKNGNLFWLLISLRLFPITPNWFLNIASPIVNIPLSLFFLSILFGKLTISTQKFKIRKNCQ